MCLPQWQKSQPCRRIVRRRPQLASQKMRPVRPVLPMRPTLPQLRVIPRRQGEWTSAPVPRQSRSMCPRIARVRRRQPWYPRHRQRRGWDSNPLHRRRRAPTCSHRGAHSLKSDFNDAGAGAAPQKRRRRRRRRRVRQPIARFLSHQQRRGCDTERSLSLSLQSTNTHTHTQNRKKKKKKSNWPFIQEK
jgi:hypothetical protein